MYDAEPKSWVSTAQVQEALHSLRQQMGTPACVVEANRLRLAVAPDAQVLMHEVVRQLFPQSKGHYHAPILTIENNAATPMTEAALRVALEISPTELASAINAQRDSDAKFDACMHAYRSSKSFQEATGASEICAPLLRGEYVPEPKGR